MPPILKGWWISGSQSYLQYHTYNVLMIGIVVCLCFVVFGYSCYCRISSLALWQSYNCSSTLKPAMGYMGKNFVCFHHELILCMMACPFRTLVVLYRMFTFIMGLMWLMSGKYYFHIYPSKRGIVHLYRNLAKLSKIFKSNFTRITVKRVKLYINI